MVWLYIGILFLLYIVSVSIVFGRFARQSSDEDSILATATYFYELRYRWPIRGILYKREVLQWGTNTSRCLRRLAVLLYLAPGAVVVGLALKGLEPGPGGILLFVSMGLSMVLICAVADRAGKLLHTSLTPMESRLLSALKALNLKWIEVPATPTYLDLVELLWIVETTLPADVSQNLLTRCGGAIAPGPVLHWPAIWRRRRETSIGKA